MQTVLEKDKINQPAKKIHHCQESKKIWISKGKLEPTFSLQQRKQPLIKPLLEFEATPIFYDLAHLPIGDVSLTVPPFIFIRILDL